jgi:hypothetical protein
MEFLKKKPGLFLMGALGGILAAIAQESGPVTVLVDNATARGNVAHMAEERGRKVTVAAEGSDFRLLLK